MVWFGIALYRRRRKARDGQVRYAFDHKIDNNARSVSEEVTVPTLEIGAPMGLGAARYLPWYASPTLGRRTTVGASTYVSEQSERPTTASPQRVIVLHRDGGRAPVRVYEEDIVELPPDYVDRGERPREQDEDGESQRPPSLRTPSEPRPPALKRLPNY